MSVTHPNRPCREVLIVGAGFSRALSKEMPLTDELGNLVMAYLHDRFEEPIPVEFRGGLFETWLSQLAEDQPYLWPDENLNQRATFSRCTTYLAEVIERRVVASLDDALSKAWMLPLLSTLHARRATLVTFNQDTLIERAIKEAELKTWDKDEWITSGEQPKISWFDATGGLPPLPARGGWDAGAPKQTFHLLKLHGSTNWFWRPGDRSSATLVSWWLEGEAEGDAARPDESAAKRRMLPGTRAFVVPPSSTKSAFYDNPLVEELWRSARRALEEATKVSLLGYSMPPTDIVTSNLLRKTLVESPAGVESSVEVVNPDPGMIVERLVAMGVSKDRITVIDSVDNYARSYVDLAAAEVARAFMVAPDASESQALLLVGSSINEALPVQGIRSEDGSTTVELILEEIPNGQLGTDINLRPQSEPCSAANLRLALREAVNSNLKIVARGPGGLTAPVIAMSDHISGFASDPKLWQVLRTSVPVVSSSTK